MSTSNEGPVCYTGDNISSSDTASGKFSYPEAAQNRSSNSTFLDLPAELRNEVYSFYFSEAANFCRLRLIADSATQTENDEDDHPRSRSYSSNHSAYLARLETAEQKSHPDKKESIRPSKQWSFSYIVFMWHCLCSLCTMLVLVDPVSFLNLGYIGNMSRHDVFAKLYLHRAVTQAVLTG